jgi:hypothetical protein
VTSKARQSRGAGFHLLSSIRQPNETRQLETCPTSIGEAPMRLPRLTTRRLMAIVLGAAVMLWAGRLWRLSTEYSVKARWFDQAVLAIADERDGGDGPAMSHYRALQAKYEHAASHPWVVLEPDPPPP